MEHNETALTRAAMRELDRRAVDEFGVPSLLLMENAGRACAAEALRLLEVAPREGSVAILCGPGNNGGDGLVIARTLANHGVPVRVFWLGEVSELARASEEVRANARLWSRMGRELEETITDDAVAALEPVLAAAPLIVDALFGTGLDRPLRDPWARAVRLMDAAPAPVLAVDVPSGLDADTGAVLGACARAASTVTFVAPKPGLRRGEGPRLCGRVTVAEIGIPRALVSQALRAAREREGWPEN
jgi:NAD(P)H-hydrate epimerase